MFKFPEFELFSLFVLQSEPSCRRCYEPPARLAQENLPSPPISGGFFILINAATPAGSAGRVQRGLLFVTSPREHFPSQADAMGLDLNVQRFGASGQALEIQMPKP